MDKIVILFIVLGIFVFESHASSITFESNYEGSTYSSGPPELPYNPNSNDNWWMVDSFSVRTSGRQAHAEAVTVFDLSSLSNQISSATLSFEITKAVCGRYDTQRTLPFALYDVNDLSSIQRPTTPLSLYEFYDAYNKANTDLSTGAIYGNFSVNMNGENGLLNITLSQAALDNINNIVGFSDALFGIGISDFQESLAGFKESIHYANSRLTVTPVPEPSTMVLFGLGLLGLAGVSRKKLKK